jgi:hypothetical protein
VGIGAGELDGFDYFNGHQENLLPFINILK